MEFSIVPINSVFCFAKNCRLELIHCWLDLFNLRNNFTVIQTKDASDKLFIKPELLLKEE